MTTPSRTSRSVSDLVEAGLVPPDEASVLEVVAERYAIAVTPEMAGLIDRGNAHDPIARQFIPSSDELVESDGERADPIGDHVHEKVPGLVHRYPNRVLLKLTHACPVYCRFCFRREMVGPGGPPPMAGEVLERAAARIANDPAIWEVILTGGDPLVLAPRRIADVTRRLAAIQHVRVLRWHTRVPVVDPGRVTDELVAALTPPATCTAPTVYVGIHANHPREITADARAAIARLRAAGIVLVSQTVLLRGVNDSVEVLAGLFRGFVELGIKPYYLHHADLAPGTGHFRTTIAEGQALMRALRGRISGLALPTYVLDVPGGHGKVPVGPAYVDADAGMVTDVHGRQHRYGRGPL